MKWKFSIENTAPTITLQFPVDLVTFTEEIFNPNLGGPFRVPPFPHAPRPSGKLVRIMLET